MATEATYAAHNYHPLQVVFARASGCSVWDPVSPQPKLDGFVLTLTCSQEGKHYLDFLSAYSAVNQGHCHPELVKALTEQAQRLTLSSRAFYNDVFPKFAEFVTKMFGYDMVLPMNTGAEAVETAVKIARKWGYKVKGIPQDEALVFSVSNNFHGRTVSVAMSVRLIADDNKSSQPYPCPRILNRATTTVPTCRTSAASAPPRSDRYDTIMYPMFGSGDCCTRRQLSPRRQSVVCGT